MFEFAIAAKYLIPRRKHLALSLISILSVFVVGLVVWLLLVFLSVLQGMEKNWIDKLTSLNAPIRITPTEEYFSSYYYLVDAHAEAAQFSFHTIREKLLAQRSDPYSAESDRELPEGFPKPDHDAKGNLRDPVKLAGVVFDRLSQEHSGFVAQDFSLSGGMLKIDMIRPSPSLFGQETQAVLTQASFVLSHADRSPYMGSLILPPSEKDIQNVMRHAQKEGSGSFAQLMAHIQDLTLAPGQTPWGLSAGVLPENIPFSCSAEVEQGSIVSLALSSQEQGKLPVGKRYWKGTIVRKERSVFFVTHDQKHKYLCSAQTPLFIFGKVPCTSAAAESIKKMRIPVLFELQKHPVNLEAPLEALRVDRARAMVDFKNVPSSSPLWAYSLNANRWILPRDAEGRQGVLLAKSYRDNGVLIGDKGVIAYNAVTLGSSQEQRIPIYVAGFYDPGIMAVGNKCVLAPPEIPSLLQTAGGFYAFDKTQSEGFLVWMSNPLEAALFKNTISKAFEEMGIGRYWKVSAFYEYDGAKDLLQQFQSDKHLFSFVGILILIVACCNIVSLLTMLVNDKKKEIGVLMAMGATQKSIMGIFGICGAAIGIIGCLGGAALAWLTLHNIDSIVSMLSALQGHEFFNALFYGNSLPHELSKDAVIFVAIATPVISLLAGLVPALRASRITPAAILRSE